MLRRIRGRSSFQADAEVVFSQRDPALPAPHASVIALAKILAKQAAREFFRSASNPSADLPTLESQNTPTHKQRRDKKS